MAELFENVFNPSSVYDMLFFNVKTVLKYPTLEKLEQENKPLYDRWLYFEKKYLDKELSSNEIYEKQAPDYQEFSQIVAITYGTLYSENGSLKRHMKKISNNDEFIVLATFMDELYQISKDGVESTPKHFPILCGHNIISHDIPLLIKKFIYYRDKFDNDQKIPYILKNCLNQKPWESGIIDTINVWKFNGYDKMSLMLIADYMGLKKTVDLLPIEDVSKKYWELINSEPEKALDFVTLQSATQTNLVIQLMNELRKL
jgi:hypothetical protein